MTLPWKSISELRAFALLATLAFYPFLSYFTLNYVGKSMDILLVLLCYAFLGHLVINTYRLKKAIRIPHYLTLFGVFVIYSIVTGLFISGHLQEEAPVKFMYSNDYVACFIILLTIENTTFPHKYLKLAIPVLFVTLLIAAGVSIIQIGDPLFFTNTDLPFESGTSKEELQSFIESGQASQIEGLEATIVNIEDNRLQSIYSWIDPLSIGFDGVGVFCVLFGLRIIGQFKEIAIVLCTALFAFLSSGRWIMLNFVVASFQSILAQKNKVFMILKYVFFAIILVVSLGFGATMLGIDVEGFIEDRLLDESAGSRLYAFEMFARVFPLAPIFGTGGVATPELLALLRGITSQIHVGWLKIFYYYGIVGGVIYISFMGALLLRLRSQAMKSGYWGGFFALFGFAVANCTLVSFDFYFSGLFLAIIYSKSIDNLEAFRNPKINEVINQAVKSEAQTQEFATEQASSFTKINSKNKPF